MTTAIEYALMAGASYISNRLLLNRFPTPEGWSGTQYDVKDSGFEAISFVRTGTTLATSPEIVISFAGTDFSALGSDFIHGNIPLAAGVLSDQLRQAADYYLQIKASAPAGTTISFTGHSLGGGLASLIAVMFDESATTFDQAPFRNAALSTYSTIPETGVTTTRSAAIDLRAYLAGGGATDNLLAKLDAYIAADLLAVREAKVVNLNVQGEILSTAPVTAFNRIGTQADANKINISSAGLSAGDLHSQALLTVLLQSGDQPGTTSSTNTLGKVSSELTDLMKMIFDAKLFFNDPLAKGDGVKENFLERLVKHQATVIDSATGATDDMVTRFTKDLWKLAQDGGMTMNDGIPGLFSNPTLVSQTLIAFAMQMYYEDTANATDRNKQLFSDVTGGISFDMADVSKTFKTAIDNGQALTLTDAKGYAQYLKYYLDNNLDRGDVKFTLAETELIKALLPYMRDWYVQAGTSGLATTDDKNRGAFMLGGTGSDALVGGSGADLLVGNVGDDVLMGGQGNDTLLGGKGNDTYVFQTGDGLDTILDRDGQGSILVDGQTLNGGFLYGDSQVYRSADGKHLYTLANNNTLLIDGQIVVEGYDRARGDFSLTFNNTSAVGSTATSNNIKGDLKPIDINPNEDGDQYGYDVLENILVGTTAETDRADFLHDSAGNDHITSGGGDDWIEATRGGDDLIEAGAGRDYVDAGAGNDVVMGGAGSDIVEGGVGDDRLYADVQVSTAAAISNGNIVDSGSGLKGDWLAGGAGDDTLVGSTGNDVLSGGSGADLLIGGAGDDDILADDDWVASSFDWTVTDPADGIRWFYPIHKYLNP